MQTPRSCARWPLQTVAVALIGAMTAGCYTTTLIPPTEVPRLSVNASISDQPHSVRDVTGQVVMIGDDFSIKLEPRPDLPLEWAHWGATSPPIKSPLVAEIRGPMLALQGANDRGVTQVPLAYVQRVRVREYSPGQTAGVAVGATLGGLTLLAGIGLLVIFAIASSG
ncbi:MAG: hypothetical protein ABI134_32815 [Byssovorax sp.]